MTVAVLDVLEQQGGTLLLLVQLRYVRQLQIPVHFLRDAVEQPFLFQAADEAAQVHLAVVAVHVVSSSSVALMSPA